MTEPSWGFYGRSVEQAEIEKILDSGRWFFCAISGRRRIGKTRLIQEALRRRPGAYAFYFQVPDSDERGVVEAFRDALEDTGLERDTARDFRNFYDVSSLIREMCREEFIISIDEFQYFHRKSLSEFTSYFQADIDKLRDTSGGGIFVLGSIHTEMTAILEDQMSPLFNRVTHRIELGHWDFATLFEMFDAHGVTDPYRRLFLWSLFEGVPKFYRDCFEQGVLKPMVDYRRETLRRLFFEGSSPLREEAANWFLRELRGRYDTVLRLLAKRGPCSHGELMADHEDAATAGADQMAVYLRTLIERYRMVEKLDPIFSSGKGRKGRYGITDNFLSAWLNALGRNVQSARIRPVAEAVARADVALESHEGFAFEKMIRQLLEECSRKAVGDFPLTDFVRGYWNKPNRTEGDIEIDSVALNEDDCVVRFGSCKRSASAHDGAALTAFDGHVGRFLATKDGRRFADWRVERALYSPQFEPGQRTYLEGRGYICRDLDDFAGFLGFPPVRT
ncbi:MAG: ATP-binding protein [Rhodospirillaceae bacterium]